FGTIFIFIISFYLGKSTITGEVGETTAESKPEGSQKLGQKISQILTQTKTAEKNVSGEKSNINLKFLEKKERYRQMAGFAKIGKSNHPLINAMIGLENPKEIDHETAEALNNELQDYIKANPEEAFAEIKNLLDSFMAKEDPSLRANLLVTCSFVPGKENETKEMALNELDTNRIPDNYFDPSPQAQRKTGEDVAVVMAYNAFLSASYKDPGKVDAQTIEILKKQTNPDIRKMIAISYHRAFPSRSPAMLNKLKSENLKIFPENFTLNP
ncbi:MAG: hypothetical protein ACHQYQ_02705, partial [Bacteriovoracales bacterium]